MADRRHIVAWFLEHPEFTRALPVVMRSPYVGITFGAQLAVSEAASKACVHELKQAGLISPNTYWRDVRVATYVGRARNQVIEVEV